MKQGALVLAVGFLALSYSQPLAAEDEVHYCIKDYAVGMINAAEGWSPIYSNDVDDKRFAIHFSSNLSEVKGVEGTDTAYHCSFMFPTKAPDVLTCVNSKVASVVFNFSRKSGRFVLSMVSPGGWLGIDTERESNDTALSDHLIYGNCQEF